MKYQLENSDLVVSSIGRWPTFHDAEVTTIVIRREPEVSVDVELIEALVDFSAPIGSADQLRYSRFRIGLTFECVEELEVNNFNEQNVIAELTCEQGDSGIEVKFWPLYGVDLSFRCSRASVRFCRLMSDA